MIKQEMEFPRNAIDTDFRAEFIAATLVEGGVPIDLVRLSRMGVSTKGKCVESISREFSHDQLKEFVNVAFRRRDLYESLPEGLFHNVPNAGGKSRQAIHDGQGRGRQETFRARFFFKPFEMAIDRMSVVAQLYELCLDKKTKYDDFVRLVGRHWSIVQGLPTEKSLLLLYFITHCHRVLSEAEIGRLLSIFLDCEVFVEHRMEQIPCEGMFCWCLGEVGLGEDSILGNSVSISLPVVKVRIRGLSRQRQDLFYEQSPAFKQLVRILNLFVPADAELRIEIGVAKQDSLFYLSESEMSYPVLGFTSVLN